MKTINQSKLKECKPTYESLHYIVVMQIHGELEYKECATAEQSKKFIKGAKRQGFIEVLGCYDLLAQEFYKAERCQYKNGQIESYLNSVSEYMDVMVYSCTPLTEFMAE